MSCTEGFENEYESVPNYTPPAVPTSPTPIPTVVGSYVSTPITTVTPSTTETIIPTQIVTFTNTATATPVPPTATNTATATFTPTPTPTVTYTPTPSPTPTTDPSLFISQWKTDNSGGVTTNTQIILPLESTGTYNFTVNWGDGSSNVITSWNQAETTHTYSSAGTYTVTISGTIRGFRFNNSGDKTKIINIAQWGALRVGNSGGYFYGCSNLNATATDALNLTGTTNLSAMFATARSFNGAIGNWNTSSVTNMNFLFHDTYFNQPIGNWDTANVTNMNRMFHTARGFNQPIGNWDTSKVTDMGVMFLSATSFNQNIGNWNTSKVTDMGAMFSGASSFNQNLSSWCVSLIPSKPSSFDSTTTAWLNKPASQPQWGQPCS